MNDSLLDSIMRAVENSPTDLTLHHHYGTMLLEAGRIDDAVCCASRILAQDPTHAGARALMTTAFARAAEAPAAEAPAEEVAAADTSSPRAEPPVSSETISGQPAPAAPDFDWDAAEYQLDTGVRPASAFRVESSTVTLADVGGMEKVKDRLNAAFLAPLRNPELRELYGKSLRGGLLMYGPPGCGKTFIARAIAGELGAKFLAVGLSDVLDPMLGVSERNVHEIFQLARREAPCVLFLDELDALGARRTSNDNNALRGVINQLLTELDGVADDNKGVFLLAATNRPWDLDPALRRPGRIDRTVLVLPPDLPAREAILTRNFADRPFEGADAAAIAQRTEGFSGADLAYLCEAASELALLDSVASGIARKITMRDLAAALSDIRPSTSGWLDSARNVVLFTNDDGTYAELKTYLKKAKRL